MEPPLDALLNDASSLEVSRRPSPRPTGTVSDRLLGFSNYSKQRRCAMNTHTVVWQIMRSVASQTHNGSRPVWIIHNVPLSHTL
jgi:hypothetical protein